MTVLLPRWLPRGIVEPSTAMDGDRHGKRGLRQASSGLWRRTGRTAVDGLTIGRRGMSQMIIRPGLVNRRHRCPTAACVVLVVILLHVQGLLSPASARKLDDDEITEIAVEAYLFAYPMILMDVTRAIESNCETAGGSQMYAPGEPVCPRAGVSGCDVSTSFRLVPTRYRSLGGGRGVHAAEGPSDSRNLTRPARGQRFPWLASW